MLQITGQNTTYADADGTSCISTAMCPRVHAATWPRGRCRARRQRRALWTGMLPYRGCRACSTAQRLRAERERSTGCHVPAALDPRNSPRIRSTHDAARPLLSLRMVLGDSASPSTIARVQAFHTVELADRVLDTCSRRAGTVTHRGDSAHRSLRATRVLAAWDRTPMRRAAAPSVHGLVMRTCVAGARGPMPRGGRSATRSAPRD